MEKNKFVNKYGALLYLAGIIIIFIVLKLIGFPEVLYK